MWDHRGYYRESNCVYDCVYVGGMLQGAYVRKYD